MGTMKTNGGWVENPIPSTTHITLEHGCGNQQTQPLNGLTGLLVSLMIGTDNSVWCTSDMTTVETQLTTGMIGIAIQLLTTFVRNHVECTREEAILTESLHFSKANVFNVKIILD